MDKTFEKENNLNLIYLNILINYDFFQIENNYYMTKAS